MCVASKEITVGHCHSQSLVEEEGYTADQNAPGDSKTVVYKYNLSLNKKITGYSVIIHFGVLYRYYD